MTRLPSCRDPPAPQKDTLSATTHESPLCAAPQVPEYRKRLDRDIRTVLQRGLTLLIATPGLIPAGIRILLHQKKAAGIRLRLLQEGLQVPPVIMVSVTSRCNLACAGCYMKGRQKAHTQDMAPETLGRLVGEAAELGVSVIVLAGGEPLLRRDEIAGLARAHPSLLFAVFTNGLLIDETVAHDLSKIKNLVLMISFEGAEAATDMRRGEGVYQRLQEVCARLKKERCFFGCSVTVTRENIGQVTGNAFIRDMIKSGARAFVYVEYVPIEPGTEHLVLLLGQKEMLHTRIISSEQDYPALFIGFPGDEAQYGGCLAAGRGFVHISPNGSLEPCPAAPFSDTGIDRMSLREALASRFLEKIRQQSGLLTESEGGCALRAHDAWVRELLMSPAEDKPGR